MVQKKGIFGLRETREEAEELVHRLGCLNCCSDIEIYEQEGSAGKSTSLDGAVHLDNITHVKQCNSKIQGFIAAVKH